MHTPSTPKVNQPASATDPRYSTSGILNAQTKERNRQGLLSTYGGRTGRDIDINKFADAKINMRNPSAVSALETLSRLYAGVKSSGNEKGLAHGKVDPASYEGRSTKYNNSVDAVNNYLASYNVKDTSLTKASDKMHHARAENKYDIRASVDNIGKSGEIFNQVADVAKKQKQPAKQ